MNKFAFIAHPLNLGMVVRCHRTVGFLSKWVSPYLLKKNLLRIPPIKFIHIKDITTKSGKTAEGIVIVCPLLPDQLINSRDNGAQEQIVKCCKIAKRWGAKIVGLGGFTSIVTDGGRSLLGEVDIAITTGNTYTVCLAIDEIFTAMKCMNINARKSVLTIVGATGDIGAACANYLVPFFSEIILVARDREKLLALKKTLVNQKAKVAVEVDIPAAVHKADVVLTATSAITTIIDVKDLKKGSILCDVSYPANIDFALSKKRKDFFAFEGGLASAAFMNSIDEKTREKIKIFNDCGSLHGCISETIVLALNGIFENYSIGKAEISKGKIDRIRELAFQSDFSPFCFVSGGSIVSQDEVRRIGGGIKS